MASKKSVITVDDVKSMSDVDSSYRSINNWQTVEETAFKGVPLFELLERSGVRDPEAYVKVVAPDGYFWPAVGDRLHLEELKRKNDEGQYAIIAYEMDGRDLDPEPAGTGPLRLVMPQFSEDEINKPSWVQNVRLIEVDPSEEGQPDFDAADVPTGELWLCGNVKGGYPYPLWVPLLMMGIGGLAIVVALLAHFSKKRKTSGNAGVAGILVLILLVSLALATVVSSECRGGSFTFTRGELQSMPSVTRKYTFLKSQPPYTYYEREYTGVPLTHILEQELELAAGAASVTVRATDGYYKTLSLSQVRATYPGDLQVIVAYASEGSPLVGDEGPFRLVVPQSVPGNKDEGGEPNTPLCVRMLYAIEVEPVPAGEHVPGADSVPSGSLAVYGSVNQRSEPAPTPGPVQPESADQAAVPPTDPQTPSPQPAADQGQPQPAAEQAPILPAQKAVSSSRSITAIATSMVYSSVAWRTVRIVTLPLVFALLSI